MPTDYASRTATANAAAAATLSELLGVPVTVDRHGMARVNAQALLDAVSALTAK